MTISRTIHVAANGIILSFCMDEEYCIYGIYGGMDILEDWYSHTHSQLTHTHTHTHIYIYIYI